MYFSSASYSPAFSEEFENCEEELKKLYTLYLMHIRCLDALRAQGITNDKNAITREPIKQASATEAPSLILLPYGIADSSDELSEDDENDDLNLNPIRESTEAVHENQMHGNGNKANQKLRIKTGGKATYILYSFQVTNLFIFKLNARNAVLLVT